MEACIESIAASAIASSSLTLRQVPARRILPYKRILPMLPGTAAPFRSASIATASPSDTYTSGTCHLGHLGPLGHLGLLGSHRFTHPLSLQAARSSQTRTLSDTCHLQSTSPSGLLPPGSQGTLSLQAARLTQRRAARRTVQGRSSAHCQTFQCRSSVAQVSIAGDEVESPPSTTGEAPAQSTEDLLLSCTTFNVLAPIYKRLGREEVRESSFREEWLPRNKQILRTLMEKKSSIICLQELWLANPELVGLYEDAFREEGYSVFKLPRTNNRGDGLLTAVREDKLQVVHHEDLHFNDSGDRVAQFLWLRSPDGGGGGRERAGAGEGEGEGSGKGSRGRRLENLSLIVVNTHLLFPHDSTSSFIRLRQVYKVLEHLETYKAEHGLGRVPIILCGDLNGSKQGQVFKFLSSQGFASSYDIAHSYPDSDERWCSHRNHRGEVCATDYVWLLNPSQQCSPLSADWKAAVFRFLKRKLSEIGYRNERQAFDFFCSAGEESESAGGEESESAAGEESESEAWQDSEEEEKDRPFAGPLAFADDLHHEVDAEAACRTEEVITIADFESAVDQLGHEMGLTTKEVRELMDSVDRDKNGVVDYDEFKAVVRHLSEEPTVVRSGRDLLSRKGRPAKRATALQHSVPVSFEVRDAELYPPETKDGVWPQDYALSDHAVLTAVFSPRERGGAYEDEDDLCAALYD